MLRGVIMDIAVCEKCGCDDLHACVDETGAICYWVRVDYVQGFGLCSCCVESDGNLTE